jgi:hypothetical protein
MRKSKLKLREKDERNSWLKTENLVESIIVEDKGIFVKRKNP